MRLGLCLNCKDSKDSQMKNFFKLFNNKESADNDDLYIEHIQENETYVKDDIVFDNLLADCSTNNCIDK